MLCPEVWNFPKPNGICSLKEHVQYNEVVKTINMNNFYKSLIVTCPDEINIPTVLEEKICVDNEYYKIKACPVTEFLNSSLINNFVNRGKLFCLSVGNTCTTHNYVAIDANGTLIIHVIEYIYQCLGLEGKKRPLGFYEVDIDLKNLNKISKLKEALSKLGTFDILISWIPHELEICPSSIAKYFCEKNFNVTVCSPHLIRRSPEITAVPSLVDSHPSEITEWIGMILHEASLYPEINYVSDYCQPDGENSIKSNRLAILHSEGLYTPDTVLNIYNELQEYIKCRELPNYWVALSVQSFSDCPWRIIEGAKEHANHQNTGDHCCPCTLVTLRSYKCIASFLDRNKIFDGGRSGPMEQWKG